jgi:hypothetical protein
MTVVSTEFQTKRTPLSATMYRPLKQRFESWWEIVGIPAAAWWD